MKYNTCIVAFIDILGFKEMVFKSGKDEDKHQMISKALGYLKNLEKNHDWVKKFIAVEEDAQKKGEENFIIDKLMRVTCFSDSILISVRLEEKENRFNEVFSTLVAYIAFVGNFLIKNGILIRGGITVGDLVHTREGVVYGRGLIKAHELESKTAINPRIILSKELIKKLNYPLESKKNRYPYHQYLSRFNDGCLGFHQLTILQVMDSLEEELFLEMFEEDKVTIIDKIKNVIINELDNNFEKTEVFSKYNWLKEEFNRLVLPSNPAREKIELINENFNIYYERQKYNKIKKTIS